MFITNKYKNLKKFYIIFLVYVLFINTVLITKSYANSFKINEIEVSEDFDLNFDKKNVFDKAFIAAFAQLTATIIISKDKDKIEKTNLSTIKGLIDSFNISDEKFVKDKYFAKVNVNFNKKNAYNFFESKKIFPSIPTKLDLLMLPILVDSNKNEIIFFGENPIYNNWNKYNQKHHLLTYILPSEDIEDNQVLRNNIEFIEEYKFEEIIRKYDLNNYVVSIINQNQENLNVLSKLNLNGAYKIFNNKYEGININDEEQLGDFIIGLKNIYEDEWKKLNLINTSIKLPMTISLASKDYKKIELFEKTLENLDLVSNFLVISLSSDKIIYKVIFNGSPEKFFKEIKDAGLNLERNNQILTIQ